MENTETTKPEIDLEKLKRERIAKTMPEFLKLFGEVDNLIPEDNSEASEKIFNEAASKFYEKMLIIFSNNGIVREDFATIFANVKATCDILEQMLKNQVGKMMNEILTTVIDIKDPMGGNDIAYAKHTDIAAAVLRLREAYGGDAEHSSYYKKTEGDPIPSPIDLSKPAEE